jgi:DNA helicase-2/ATP-dependent DNA helicase PcrA
LVLGEAGHGKTTVALHRLLHLWRTAPDARTPRVAMVVPTEGLARLIQPLLRKLGIDVEALTFDRWAAAQARRAMRDVPRHESEQASPLVARFKRDPAVRAALTELATREVSRIDDDDDAPRVRSRALVRRADLQHLFGDRVLLETIARASSSVTPRMIDDVLEHTRVQFSLTAEQEWAHVTERARLVAVDRRRLDDGTAFGDAGTIDVEDYAVLFELDRLRAVLRGRPPTTPKLYDAIVLDEAQEFAPLELALLGRSLRPDGTLVVAGDAEQQTDTTTRFGGWEGAMRELGCPDHETVRLDVGYRCAPAVVSVAHHIRGGLEAPGDSTSGPQDMLEPACHAFTSEQELAERLGEEVRALQRRDPRTSVAAICRSPLTARRLVTAFRSVIPARLVFDGRFFARGPIQVTVVDEVKGLEFDFVLVPDATEAAYPDTADARRALYVAATRARHQVLFAAVGTPTALLRPPRGRAKAPSM